MTTIPAVFGGDLPPQQRDAYDHGHDADLELGSEGHSVHSGKLSHEVDIEEKSDRPTSFLSATDSRPKDIGKGVGDALAVSHAVDAQQDPDIVDWDGPDDPHNPLNWPERRKWTNIMSVSAFTLIVPLASSMFAPGVPEVLSDFQTDSQALATFVVSVYLLGVAAGPLVVAPLSELYGRLWVYHICNAGFVVFTVACALSTNMNMLIGFRFLAGMIGAAPLTIGGGTIADLVRPERRGRAMSIWSMGPLLGPIIGPVAGGFLAEADGWRWIFWVIAIAMGVASVVGLFLMQETYAVVLLARKAERLRKETGNMNLRSKLDLRLSAKEVFKRAIVRPSKLLVLSPICFVMSFYMAIIYAFLYLLFTTFTFVFEQTYDFSEGTVGLVYLGAGIGMMGGLIALGIVSDPIMHRLARKHNNGTFEPEYRLPPLIFAAPFIPIGLLIYGWTAQYQVQWAAPLFGTLLVGVGLIAAFLCINTYLVDAFTMYAASAMAANTVLRSVFGATFPLFGLQMYAGLGLGWGNSLLGFIALALCPIPILFYWYGKWLRTHPRLQVRL